MTTPERHAAGDPLLAIEGVGKRFGGHRALADVTLSVRTGEIIALAGENGAGKSTLMAICSGALPPDEGHLRWNGTPVRFQGTADARRAGIAIVHQEPQLVGCLSVAENLLLGELPRRAGGFVDWEATRQVARTALARVGLELPLDVPIATLGPGVRQLVAIARAVHGGARLLILDEPTSSLTLEDARRLAAIVREVAAQGTAVIYISHRIEELRPLAHRLVVLRDGRVSLDAPLASVSPQDLWTALAGRPSAEPPVRTPPDDAVRHAEPLLEVRGLSHGNRLRSVSLDVRPGEIVGLAGLVGSGRSRLLHTIFGHERADAGSVHVRTAAGLTPIRSIHEAIAAGVGFVPEDRRRQGLVLGASVADNVALAIPRDAVSRGMLRRRRILETASTAIERLRIRTQGVHQPVRDLSGGNQQKVLLARWLRAGTRVLLLDEPTRGVDVGAKAEIHQYLGDAAASGMALLVASSDLPELLVLCRRIYVMRAGSIVGEVEAAGVDTTRLLTLASGAAA
ncbi:MAG TPA: sugar ABC transporter ATP-binding protein [Vicinamibacterales bacterium]|nr:sugar ABC transporter ATP-binding protein [Vicinamibacterales bacterium]